MWKKKKQKEQFSFNTEKVFLAATQPLGSVFQLFPDKPDRINAGRGRKKVIPLRKERNRTRTEKESVLNLHQSFH